MSSCFILNLAGIPVVLMKIIFFSLPPRGARYTVEAPGVVDVVGACWEEGAPGGEEPWGCGTSTHPQMPRQFCSYLGVHMVAGAS